MSAVATMENTVRNSFEPRLSPNAIPGFSVNVNRKNRPTTGIDSCGAIVSFTHTLVSWSTTTTARVTQRTRMALCFVMRDP